MKTVALLRSNPKDAAMLKTLAWLSSTYRVGCYLWDRQGDYVPIVKNKNLSYILCPVRAGYHDLKTLFKLIIFQLWLFGKLLTAHYDIIHAIDLDTGLVGLLIAKIRRKKLIYQCLDPYYAALPSHWPSILSHWARDLEDMVISHADLFIITDKQRLPQHKGATPRRLIELPNIPNLGVEHSPPMAGPVMNVGYLGSLTEGRNLLTLIEAVGELQSAGIRLIVGGFGPLEEQAHALADLYDNVSFLPWVPYDRLLAIEAEFDLFVQVLDGHEENVRWGSASPNKLFEAMAFGKPIIVGRETLTAQRVEAFGNGVAVTYGSKKELQDAILKFKKNPELVRDMGEKGRTEFQRNWRPEIMEKRLLDAYDQIFKSENQ